MFDVIVKGATIVSHHDRKTADLAITGGKIEAILDPAVRTSALRTVDATGLVVMPGLVDTHVHLRDPARPDRETFETGTAAAAAGGVTVICEMPTSDPPVNTADRLAKRADHVGPRALVDFALYGGAGLNNLDEIPLMAKAGAVAFKTWLHSPATGREHEFSNLCCPDMQQLPPIMEAVAATGLRHALHCEHEPTLLDAAEGARELSGPPGRIYAASRPVEAEETSVENVLRIAKQTGSKVQIVHLSSPSSARLVEAARRSGVDATIETCPHYLVLNQNTLETFGPFAKCNPPLRPDAVIDRLWECVADGLIDVIGTDHCPYLDSELRSGENDIFASPPGLPGLETIVPILLSSVKEGRFELEDMVRLTSYNASRIFNLKTKGLLAPGFDADFVIVDPAEEWTYDSSQTFSKAGKNARYFEGYQFTGRVKQTWARGAEVFNDGKITGGLGKGRFITPA